LKEEALDRTVWRAGFGTSFGTVVRQTAKLMSKGPNFAQLLKHALYKPKIDTNQECILQFNIEI
jgi:hypothetical protein